MSYFGLSITSSALDAYQTAENVTSNNIADVNTPGASRQSANLVEAPPAVGSAALQGGSASQGDGVLVQSITRVHQDSYDGLFRGATAGQSYYDVEQQQLTSLQNAFGEPGSGVNTAFTNLQAALSQFASSSATSSDNGESTARAGVISAAQAFTSRLNGVGNAIATQASSTVQQVTTVVGQANDLIDQIASLNGQIRASTALGDNPNTYKDQRDQAIDQLSALVPTQTSVQANGSVLVAVNGIAVVNDTKAYDFATPTVAANAAGTPQIGLSIVDPAQPGVSQPVTVDSGTLGGYVDLYNTKLASYGQQLDAFANAAATEIDRVTTAGYDANGQPGAALLQSSAPNQPVTAATITVGITQPSQVAGALATTAAGTLTVAMNSANNTVSTSEPLSDATFGYPANTAGATTGTLTVTVDGVNQSFAYDFGAGKPQSTINGFVSTFNAAQLGVTAAFDPTSQKIVFTRDPGSESTALRAQTNGQNQPAFTIADSNPASAGGTGSPTTSLLQVLGGAALSGVAQNAGNAVGTGDTSVGNALARSLAANVGIPSLAVVAGNAAPMPAGTVVLQPPATSPGAYAAIQVGQVLTLDPGGATQEKVVVSAVNRATGSLTVQTANAHTAPLVVASAATQTLSSYYGQLVTQMGTDARTATTGSSAQSTLASNLNATRQSIDGININEETQNLVQYQNSYQAAARTMNVLEQLLQTAIGLIP
jgi:flagellar hook-associated protein 1